MQKFAAAKVRNLSPYQASTGFPRSRAAGSPRALSAGSSFASLAGPGSDAAGARAPASPARSPLGVKSRAGAGQAPAAQFLIL